MYFPFLFQCITAAARSAAWARGQGLTGIPQMASPGCRRWRHKGRTSTNAALNRYGRSRSALYRADMAMETLPNGRFTRWGRTLARAAHTCPVGRPGCYRIGRRHGGKGAGRSPSIRRRISANTVLGMATSANAPPRPQALPLTATPQPPLSRSRFLEEGNEPPYYGQNPNNHEHNLVNQGCAA